MNSGRTYDPVFLNCFRETFLILLVWIVFASWVIGYSLAYGYYLDPDTFSTVLGIPSWVFWGIALPWLVAIIVTIVFAVFVIKDDPLEQNEEHAENSSGTVDPGPLQSEG